MDRPARSTDLNAIENLWGELVLQAYAEYRQYDDVESLADAVSAAWGRIDAQICKNILNSMPKRCLKVIKKRGRSTPY